METEEAWGGAGGSNSLIPAGGQIPLSYLPVPLITNARYLYFFAPHGVAFLWFGTLQRDDWLDADVLQGQGHTRHPI